MNEPTNNPISLTNLYPTAKGSTTTQAGSASGPSNIKDTSDVQAVSPIERAFAKSLIGEPVKAWIAIVIVLFAGMWLATRFKGSAQAANVKFTLYNIIAVVTLSIAGGAIAKVVAARWSLPFGVSTVILAS